MLGVYSLSTLEHLRIRPIQTMPLRCWPRCPLQAIVFAFTTTGYILGPDGERALKDRLERRSNGIPVLLQCLATVAAFRALGCDALR